MDSSTNAITDKPYSSGMTARTGKPGIGCFSAKEFLLFAPYAQCMSAGEGIEKPTAGWQRWGWMVVVGGLAVFVAGALVASILMGAPITPKTAGDCVAKYHESSGDVLECMSGLGLGAVPPLAPHHWTVVTLNGKQAGGASAPNLYFRQDRIDGWTGCNTWDANYLMDGDLILVNQSSIEVLTRGCDNPTQQAEFRAVIEDAPLWASADKAGIALTSPSGTLQLRSGD